ncbi:MAG: hypothetical protein ACR2HV_00920 [Acidimicrobiales bacterium]
MPALSRIVVGCVLTATIAGCGGGTDSAQPTVNEPTTSGRTADTADTGSGGALKRKDVPAAGVAEQLSFEQTGDPPCSGPEPDGPVVTIFSDTAEPTVVMGRYFDICFPGFVPDQAVVAECTFPDGTTQERRVDDFSLVGPDGAGIAYIFWYTAPGQPLGRYEISATQGRLRATGAFVVERATRERLQVIPPEQPTSDDQLPPVQARRGTSIPVALAGFAPRSSASLNLYHDGDYVTTVTAGVDDTGQTLYQLATEPDDPSGTYCVVLASAETPDCGWFSNMFGLAA